MSSESIRNLLAFLLIVGSIDVVGAQCAAAPGATEIEVEGFVADIFCLKRGTSLDKNLNMFLYPENHTLHCLVEVGVCVESGYAIMKEPAQGESEYGVSYALDDSANAEVVTAGLNKIKASSAAQQGFIGKFKGYPSSDMKGDYPILQCASLVSMQSQRDASTKADEFSIAIVAGIVAGCTVVIGIIMFLTLNKCNK
eukprot:m.15335 g.15335  ORF g.15335 m.15335 type:complete len:197 (-) comp5361_c0_seq1:74-664(-)